MKTRMRKGIVVLGVIVAGLMVSSTVLATGYGDELRWRSELLKCPRGVRVLDITHSVWNDVDSGLGGAWAADMYRRHLRVWRVAPGTFCAAVEYHGDFLTDDGPSPGNTDTIAARIRGSFEGGYRAIITGGTLNPTPPLPTWGDIGTFNYNCNVETDSGGHETCTGLFSWLATYFSAYGSFDYEWWGWIYRTHHNGTWINACTGPDPNCPGNSGDITD